MGRGGGSSEMWGDGLDGGYQVYLAVVVQRSGGREEKASRVSRGCIWGTVVDWYRKNCSGGPILKDERWNEEKKSRRIHSPWVGQPHSSHSGPTLADDQEKCIDISDPNKLQSPFPKY